MKSYLPDGRWAGSRKDTVYLTGNGESKMKKNGSKPGSFMRWIAVLCAAVIAINALPVHVLLPVAAEAAQASEESTKTESKNSSEEDHSKKEDSKREDSNKDDSDKKDSEKKESKKEDSKNDDSDKKDSEKQESKKEESKKDESDRKDSEDDSPKVNSGKDESSKADTGKESEKGDSGKEDGKKEDSDKTEESVDGGTVASSDGEKDKEGDDGKKDGEGKEDDSRSGSSSQEKGEGDGGSEDKKDGEKDSEGNSEQKTDTGKSDDANGKGSSGTTKNPGNGEKKSDNDDNKTGDDDGGSESLSGSAKSGTDPADEMNQSDVEVRAGSSDDALGSDDVVTVSDKEVKLTASIPDKFKDRYTDFGWSVKNGSGSADEDAVHLDDADKKAVRLRSVEGKKGGSIELLLTVQDDNHNKVEKVVKLKVRTAYKAEATLNKSGTVDVGTELSVSLDLDGDSDKEDAEFTYKWQKKDGDGDFNTVNEGKIKHGESKTLTAGGEGTYRAIVLKEEGEDSNRQAFRWESGEIKAEKVSVKIEWESKSKTYDGSAVFSYSGKGTIKRKDNEEVIGEITLSESQSITLSGADKGDYEADIDYGDHAAAYKVDSSKAKLTIDPLPLQAEVTIPGKNFDNKTTVLDWDEAPSVEWSGLDSILEGNKDNLKLLLGGSALGHGDVVYSSAGDVENDTEVDVSLTEEKEGAGFAVSGSGGESDTIKYSNYVVSGVTFTKATIKALVLNADDVAEVQSGVYNSRNNTTWVEEDKDKKGKVSLSAKEGFSISSDYSKDEDFAGTLDAEVAETGGIVFYAKNASGEIGKIQRSDIRIDKTAPTVNTVDIKKISNANFVNKYNVKDTDAGIQSVKVKISDTDQSGTKPGDDDASWETITIPNKESSDTNEFTFEITVPAYGYVYVYAEDVLKNSSMTQSHVAIYEDASPAVTITCADAGSPTKGKSSISVNAQDPENGSGVKYVEVSLKDKDGSGVSNAFTVNSAALPEGVTFENDQFTRNNSDPESLEEASAYRTLEVGFSIREALELDGDYTLTAAAYDYCGNKSEEQRLTLKFDNTKPCYSVTLDDNKGSAVEKDNKKTYYYNASSGKGLTVTFTDTNLSSGGDYSAQLCDSKENEVNGTALTLVEGSSKTKGTVSFSASEISTLQDGVVTLKVSAVDAAGNTYGANALTGTVPAALDQGNGVVSFVLDKVAPTLSTSATVLPEGAAAPVLAGTNYYYSSTFETTATVVETNMGEESMTASFSENPGESAASVRSEDAGRKFVFSGLAEGSFGYLTISGKDYAGNPLGIEASDGMTGQDEWEVADAAKGEVRTKCQREIEMKTPLATVSYKSSNNYLQEKRTVGTTAYYNDTITAEIKLTQIAEKDCGLIKVAVQKDDELLEESDWKAYTACTCYSYTDGENPHATILLSLEKNTEDHSTDGNYRIWIRGVNRAGTALQVKETSPTGTKADHAVDTQGNEYGMEYTLVLDTTNPVAKVEITPAQETANTALNTAYGNRYYFNKNHTAKIAVTERNLNLSDEDKGIVRVSFAQMAPATKNDKGEDQEDGYSNAAEVALFTGSELETVGTISGSISDTDDTAVFECTANTDGVRQYLVEGEDLAGNPIEYIAAENEGTIDSSFAGADTGVFASYLIVTDTVTPLMNLIVTATETINHDDGTTTEETREAYRMDSTGAILTSAPYQRAGKAAITAQLVETDAERTPYRLSFHEEATNGTHNDCSDDSYAVSHSLSMDENASLVSPLVFWVEGFCVEDLAGNKSPGYVDDGNGNLVPVYRTHDIYLDTDMPVAVDQDMFAPTIELYPTIQSDARYGTPGTPLFNEDVPFAVKVEDPYGPDTDGGRSFGSSGLGNVSYRLQYTKKDGDSEELVELIADTSVDKDLFPFQKTKKDGESDILDDGSFVYRFEGEPAFTIDGEQNNYNSLLLTVTAVDNVGNEATATYSFGIDTTSPVITLSYDENDVTNEIYFNAKNTENGRTATITVRERNFDPSLLTVTVTGDANGSTAEKAGIYTQDQGWEYTKGSAVNGDEDTYTYEVEFKNDGDYTLDISAGAYSFLKDDGNSEKKYAIVDYAGNPAELTVADGTRAWDKFVIDRLAPNASVSMGGGFQNGPDTDGHFYYKADNCGIIVTYNDNGREFGMEGGQYGVTIDGRTDEVSRSLPLEKQTFGSGVEKYRVDQTIEYTAEELAQGDERLLADGEHAITVTAVDAAGNEASSTQFIADSTGCEFEGMTGTFFLGTQRPKVTKISTVCTDVYTNQLDPVSDNQVYSDTNSAYYNKNIEVRIEIEGFNVRASDFNGTVTKNDGEASTVINAVFTDDSEKEGTLVRATYNMNGDNAYIGLVLSGRDKSGNLLQLAENYSYKTSDGKTVDELQQDEDQSAIGEVSAKHGKVVDKTNPTAKITYESDDYANIYSGETKRETDTEGNDVYYESAYYNKPITVKIHFEDNCELDGRKLHSGKVGSESAEESGADGLTAYDAADIKIEQDGRGTYTAYGTDRALNPTLVSEMIPNTDDSHNNSYRDPVEAGASFVPVYEIVLDMTNPVASVGIDAPDTKYPDLNTQYGNRYYFNAKHSVTVNVIEENLNVNKEDKYKGKGIVEVLYAEKAPETKDSVGIDQNDGYKDASTVSFTLSEFATENEITRKETTDGAMFTYDIFAQGVRQYIVRGEDLAGNPVIYDTDDVNTKNIDKSFSGNAEGVFASYPIVTDTKTPVMNLVVTAIETINNNNGTTTEKNKEAYWMDSTGAIFVSEPYQKAEKAIITAQLAKEDAERTPYTFSFHEEATNGEKIDCESPVFAVGDEQILTYEVNSPLVFWVDGFCIEDLAGNRSLSKYKTAEIYLDSQNPQITLIDEEAPTIVLYPKERSGYEYGVDGRPLFNDDVPFEIKVEDPYGPENEGGKSCGSTGIGNVSYILEYKDKDGNDIVLQNEADQTLYSYSESPLNSSSFVYDLDKTVTINKKNNYNSLTLTVIALDNAGNKSEENYKFGIDATEPSIKLSYDNNSARNTKYFKNPRTATIKVIERNFDPNLLSVNVTGNANGSSAINAGKYVTSEWTCTQGDADNRDDDVWKKTVTFENDGDYTVAIVANDYKYLKKKGEEAYAEYAVIDRAGNPAKLTDEEKQTPYSEFTIDRTAPIFSFKVKSKDSTNKKKNEQGNRYYFNKEYTASLTVSEVNYDSNDIFVKRGSITSGKYNSQKAVIDKYDERIISNNRSFTDIVDEEGIYRYVVFGCDMAGNPLVPEDPDTDNSVNIQSHNKEKNEKLGNTGSLDTEADISVHVVVDKTKPSGTITVNEVESDKPLIYKTDIDGNVSYAAPYRKTTKASVAFKVYCQEGAERSPVKIDYEIESQKDNDGKPKTEKDLVKGGEYKYGNKINMIQNGKQVFRITEYTLTDLAGNVTEYYSGKKASNRIYLDVESPIVDELAPISSIKPVVAKKGTSSTANGQKIFASDVTLKITVEDPNPESNKDKGVNPSISSGLAEVTYQLSIGNKLISEDTSLLHSANVKEYNRNYKDNSEDDKSKIDWVIEKKIEVPAGSHNYNNLCAIVHAYDNSGNESTKKLYFGIDITKPKVEVNYDNNDAKNGEYFNKDRTATVVVTERNFDKDKFKIKTESGASIGSWTHKSNGGNGDKDTWTSKVLYSKDGNYTLEVGGTDLVNNKTSSIKYNGTAPQKFTIDKTAPSVEVTYDNNNAKNTKYYNAARVATIKVNDVNFGGDNAINVSASGGGSAPSVSFNGGGTATLNFSQDGIYIFNGTVTDKAGNTTTIPVQTEFVIDRTPPGVTVTYNNNDVKNGKYYKAARNATINVNDVNFNGQNSITVNASGGGSAPSVGFRGKSADLPFNEDGIYSFSGTVTDMAGNVTTIPTQEEFVIDTKVPVLRFADKHPFEVTPGAGNGASDHPVNNQFFTEDDFSPNVTVVDVNCSTAAEDAVFKIDGTKKDNHFVGAPGAITGGGSGEPGQFDIGLASTVFNVVSERDDVYTVISYAIDLAGNKSEEVTFTFSINRFGSNYVADEESGTRAYIRDQYYHNDTDHDLLIREYNPSAIKKDTQKVELIVNGDTSSKYALELGEEYEFVEGSESRVGGRIYLYTIRKSVFEEEGDYSFTISSEDEAGHKNSTSVVHYDKDEDGNEIREAVHSFPIEFVVDKTPPTNQLAGVSSNTKQTFNKDSLTIDVYPEDMQTSVSEVEIRRWVTSTDFFGNPSVPVSDTEPDEIVTYRYFEDGEIPADEGNTRYADLFEYTDSDTDTIKIDYSIDGSNDWQVVEVITTDAAGNRSTDIRAGGISEAGGTINESRRNYLVTTNFFSRMLNNPAVRIGFIGAVGLIIVLIFLKKRKKDSAA